MTTSSPPLLLHQLHPVEQFLALLLTSAAALHRLFSEPPRPLRRPVPHSSTAIAMTIIWKEEAPGSGVISPEAFEEATGQEWAETHIRQPQASAAPAHGIAPGLTVAELRTMARQRGMRSVDGRPLKYCRKARLVEVLSNG